MTKLLTVELNKQDITPLALGILELSVRKGISQGATGIQLDIGQNILHKIERYYPGGMHDYLEQKVREYVQCLIFWDIVEILSGKKVSIQMQYFQNDLMHGRDALMGNWNRERIALDVTNPRGIESKVEKISTIAGHNAKSKQWRARNHYLEERLWKLAVWIPSKLTGIALWEINTSPAFDPNLVRSTVHSIVSDSTHQWLIDTIQVVWLNRKWSYQLNGMLQNA